MDISKVKLYHYYFSIAVVVIFIGIAAPDTTLDVNIQNTYFLMAYLQATILISLLYFFTGIGYWIVQKYFNKTLVKAFTIIHSVILIGSFISYWLLIALNKILAPLILADDNLYVNEMLVVSLVLIIFIAQPAYIANLIYSIFRRRN